MRTKLTATLVVLGFAGLWSAVETGCGSSTPAPEVATGSGAFGVVTVNGKQLLYLPLKSLSDAGGGQIAVVDVGIAGNGVTDAGTPAQVTVIDLGDGGLPTATGGDKSVMVAAGTYTHTVWFIDPTTNTVTDSIQLDPSLNQASFSGGAGFVNGIAIDEANHRAILSVWNGLLFVDLGSHKVTGSVLAAGAENFGYDSTRQYVLSPYYNCGGTGSVGNGDGGGAISPPCESYVTVGDAGGAVISQGLNLIDIHKTPVVVYTYENALAEEPTSPLGSDPDSAAVDTTSGLAMLSSEGSGTYSFIDLSKASLKTGTNADGGAFNYFTAPTATFSPVTENDDGVAVEPASHLAFCEQEFVDHVSVVDLTKVSTSDSKFAPGAFADAIMPSLPDGNSWENLPDPHGIAVTTGISSGNPVGFVVTDQSDFGQPDIWVARIDLRKMLSLGTTAGTTLTAQQFAPAVTLLDATRKE